MSYIKLIDTSFSYPNGFLAVDSINLEIEQGENIAIVGQNGAGKTTTVKMLNGLLLPSSGDIVVDGQNTKEHTTAEMSRLVGYVFQNPDDQIFHSTIYDEVAFGPKKLRREPEWTERMVLEALEITGMLDKKNENPYDLPFSTRKFVTIAAIIAMDSPVMVFDEPTAGQDISGNRQLEQILQKLKAKGKTLITISHDMEFVANNFSRVVVMANKKIVCSGTPREVFWNFDAMETAMIKQPYISQLCGSLKVGDNPVKMDEAIQAILSAAGLV